jgi:hypothetical protein
MKEKIKRKIIFLLIAIAIISAPLDVAWGLYFGVMANLMINAFWNSKLFPEKKKTDKELIVESVAPPTL